MPVEAGGPRALFGDAPVETIGKPLGGWVDVIGEVVNTFMFVGGGLPPWCDDDTRE